MSLFDSGMFEGASFYRFSELMIGDRYEITFVSDGASAFDTEVEGRWYYKSGDSGVCEVAQSSSVHCEFVARENSVDLKVESEFSMTGASYEIRGRRLAGR